MDDRIEKTITYALVPVVLLLGVLGIPELGLVAVISVLFSRNITQIRKESRIREQFPEFLLQLSSYIKYLPLEKALERIGVETPLKEKVREFRSKLETTKNITEAVKVFASSRDQLISLSGRVLEITYKTGKEMSYILQSLGKEMIKENIRKRDAEIGLLIERYTLLIGGGLLVPGILGISFSFSSTLNIDFPEIGMTQNSSLTQAILLANRIYLTVYSIIVGSFLGSGKNRVIYVVLLMMLTQMMFTVTSSIKI